MADIQTKTIGELEPRYNLVPPDGVIAVETATDTGSIELATIKADILNNSNLTGDPQAPTPNPGDDSDRIATTGWVQDELSGLGLNPATVDDFGTVKTFTTEANPIVYTKLSVDNLLTNKAAIGSNNDITALTALASVPSVVTTAINTAVSPKANAGSNSDITALTALASVPAIITTAINNGDNALDARLDTLEGQNLNTRLTAVEGDIAIASGSWNSVTGANSLVGLAGNLSGQSTITGVSFSNGGFCSINQPGLYLIQAAGPLSSSATVGNFATLMHFGIGMQSNGVGAVTDSVRWSGTNFSDRIINGIQGNVVRLESIGTGQTRLFQVLINNNALNGTWTGALAIIVIRLKRY